MVRRPTVNQVERAIEAFSPYPGKPPADVRAALSEAHRVASGAQSSLAWALTKASVSPAALREVARDLRRAAQIVETLTDTLSSEGKKETKP